jgi:hypothetical protein
MSKMKVNIIPDEEGWQRLTDAAGYVKDYREKEFKTNPTGKGNARLYAVQQNMGFEWSFTIWHTVTGFFCEIKTEPFKASIAGNDEPLMI